MNAKQLQKLGIYGKRAQALAREATAAAAAGGVGKKEMRKRLIDLAANPKLYLDDDLYGGLAAELVSSAKKNSAGATENYPTRIRYKQYGTNIEPSAIAQMENATRLPIALAGALMPDAHQGYGLPIGGVLGTDNAVIPYAVGMDIACRMKMSVLDLPISSIEENPDRLISAIEQETAFGVGASLQKGKRRHPVMDIDWSFSPLLAKVKAKAAEQLGSSGSGNHFVEYGVLEVSDSSIGIAAGSYLALLTHSGSRGAGAEAAGYYSRVASRIHPGLPPELKHLAWLDLDTEEGREYWRVMELLGKYSAANHQLIHQYIANALEAGVLLDIENHHNFAWIEKHFGREMVVHRKGATPAAAGEIGIIPGSMATPAYVVRGKGAPESLNSASHGAGRLMSRKAAKKKFNWEQTRKLLAEKKVRLISAGLDEAPMAYKDIESVMRDQADLVEVLAKFEPRLVKMAPGGRNG